MGFFGDLFGGKKGESTQNLFNDPASQASANTSLQNALSYQGSNAALDPVQSSRTATSEVQNNGITGGLFGKGGQLSQAEGEATNLANRGYSLKPEDYEAYGQGSGNIAREFDSGENNLAQALSSRGLSTSGVANQAFMGSQGNKLEQLGQLQRQIANDRMNTNMQRLGQTRNFLTQLGQQGENAIQNQHGRQLGSEQQNFNEAMGKANQAENYLSQGQNQMNNQFAQNQATQTGGLGGALSSGLTAGLQAAPGMLATGGLNKAFGGTGLKGGAATPLK